ncbi:polyhydroxyalkanoate biosynthesis repressor PhaR [Neobacillus sp. NRS-1170]|uniref:polyhydroxyalkanoate biosynthesis repressor PhaR n=1 Tax=Neobacillus sp. NRS-1170 TaxID=3233898 RepID=UPI003D2CA3FA
MPKHSSFDPYEMFTKLTTESEKQVNELFRFLTNNNEFVRTASAFSDSSTLFQEGFKKYQQMMETKLNIPSKMDLENIIKLSIQTEEKVDSLEEEIWKLQSLVTSSNKEIKEVVGVSRDIINLTKKLKTDVSQAKEVQAEIKEMHSELEEIKKGLADFKLLKEEVSMLVEAKKKNTNKKKTKV